MMAEAVANDRTHLIMEVSSQAYLVKRVYGLTFDVGVFSQHQSRPYWTD